MARAPPGHLEVGRRASGRHRPSYRPRPARASATGRPGAAGALVRDLPTIPWDDLPRKAGEAARLRGRVETMLRARLEGGPVDPELRSRIAVVLLHTEPARAIDLADRLLACGPDEHRAIREVLRPRRAEIAPRLHSVLEDPGADDGRRARAAAALIAFDGADPTNGAPMRSTR